MKINGIDIDTEGMTEAQIKQMGTIGTSVTELQNGLTQKIQTLKTNQSKPKVEDTKAKPTANSVNDTRFDKIEEMLKSITQSSAAVEQRNTIERTMNDVKARTGSNYEKIKPDAIAAMNSHYAQGGKSANVNAKAVIGSLSDKLYEEYKIDGSTEKQQLAVQLRYGDTVQISAKDMAQETTEQAAAKEEAAKANPGVQDQSGGGNITGTAEAATAKARQEDFTKQKM